MTPENKDVAGLLPSSEDECAVFEAWVAREAGPTPDRLRVAHCRMGWLAAISELTLAAPGAAIAAREQEAPERDEQVKNYPLNRTDARLIVHALESATQRVLGDVSHEQYKNAVGWQLAQRLRAFVESSRFYPAASRQEAPVASGHSLVERLAGKLAAVAHALGEDAEARALEQEAKAALASPSGAGLGGAVASSEALSPAAVVEPEFFTVFALYEGGGETGWIALPGYSNETEHGVKNLVLEAARKEGYKGTVTGRLQELGWEIRPVYATPRAALASQPGCAVEGEAVALIIKLGEGLAQVCGDDAYYNKHAHDAFDAYDEWCKHSHPKRVNSTEMIGGA